MNLQCKLDRSETAGLVGVCCSCAPPKTPVGPIGAVGFCETCWKDIAAQTLLKARLLQKELGGSGAGFSVDEPSCLKIIEGTIEEKGGEGAG